ncbi:MAG: hypothetical protein J2P31_19530 [Blastocatellia bacterium]|nr:hypothetical protein [Blastocatellia bacterium]
MEKQLNRENEDPQWSLAAAEAAYAVIARYVDHAQVSGLLIAMLASALGEERLKPIVQSEYWQSYLASKRSLTEAREEIERLTLIIERMREEQK